MNRLIDAAFRWVKWGGVVGVGLVYMRYTSIYMNPYTSSPTDDPWYYINNHFFFAEHWAVAGVIAAFTWVVSIADRWSSVEDESGWRRFVPALLASALALLFWVWAGLLAMLELANSLQ